MARLKSLDNSVFLTPTTGTGDVTLSAGGGETFASQSVTSGTAFQPTATRKCTLLIKDVVATAAQTGVTATLELGPTSATVALHKIDTATVLPDVKGLVYARTIPVPKGWYVKFTLSSTTDATITACKFT
jgi:hypothetical protein